ncbi:MAG: hypothetical protein WDN67_03965 [Candidatus Moraniibacteriota bacterium]
MAAAQTALFSPASPLCTHYPLGTYPPAFYSISASTTLREVLRLFDLFTLSFFAYAFTKSREDTRTLLAGVFASSLLPILFGLYQTLFGIGFSDETVSIPRIFGTFSHPNIFSLYLFCVIVFAFLYLITFARVRSERLTLSIFLGILLIMLLLTFARVPG